MMWLRCFNSFVINAMDLQMMPRMFVAQMVGDSSISVWLESQIGTKWLKSIRIDQNAPLINKNFSRIWCCAWKSTPFRFRHIIENYSSLKIFNTWCQRRNSISLKTIISHRANICFAKFIDRVSLRFDSSFTFTWKSLRFEGVFLENPWRKWILRTRNW